MQQEALHAMTSERRAKSDMEHEALLRLEASERASCAEKAEKEAQEAREAIEQEAESLRAQVPYIHDHKNETRRMVRALFLGVTSVFFCRICSSLTLTPSHLVWSAAGNGSGVASGQGLGTRQASGQRCEISEGRGRQQQVDMPIPVFLSHGIVRSLGGGRGDKPLTTLGRG